MKKHIKYFILSILSAALLMNLVACNKNSGEETVESTGKYSRSKKSKDGGETKETEVTDEEKEIIDIKPLNYLTYVKGGSLYYDKLDGSESTKVFDYNPEEVDSMYIEIWTELSKNQNRLIYIKGAMHQLFAGTLCYRDIDEDGNLSDEIVIAEEVNSFSASADGDVILYLIGTNYSDNILYEYNAKSAKSTEVSERVYYCRISDDGKRAVYVDDDGMMFERNISEQKNEQLDESAYIGSVVGDLEKYYYIDYTDYRTLYLKEFGKKAEVIDKNVISVSEAYKNGEIYYQKLEDESESIDVENLIADDMQEQDAETLSKADSVIEDMEYPSYQQYQSDEEYYAALNIYQANEALRLEVEEVHYRNAYRDDIKEDLKATVSKYALYYYDTKKIHRIGDWVTDYYDKWRHYGYAFPHSINEDEPMIVFSEFDSINSDKLNMSQLFTINDFEYNVAETAMFMKNKTKLAIGNKVVELEFPEDAPKIVENITYSEDNKSIYISKLDNVEGYYDGKLYQAKLDSSDKIKCEFLAENIASYSEKTTKNGDLYYETGNPDANEYNLWKNSKIIYKDASLYDISPDGRYISISVNEDEDIETYRNLVLIDGKEVLLDEESDLYVRFDKNNNIIFTKSLDEETYAEDIYIYDEKAGKRLIAEGATFINIELVAEDFAD